MKARKRNSNDNWEEVDYVQLKNSFVITKADQMEFNISHEKEQTEDEHWQYIRERAAIAAMQGLSANPKLFYENSEEKIDITARAIRHANALIEKLKEK